MALIQCYECEREISDQAPACPHCGASKEGRPPEPVATKDERFNSVVAFVVGIFVFQIARALGMSSGPSTVVFLLVPWALLVRYGKKQSPQAYAGIIGALVVVFGIAIAAGPGDVFIPTSVE